MSDEDPDMCQKHVKQLHLDNQEAVYFEDVEIEGYSDDEASSDEAEDEEYPQDKSIWPFKVPALRFQGKTYTDMIDWRRNISQPHH